MNTPRSEQGGTLLISIVILFIVSGFSMTYLSLAIWRNQRVTADVEREKALYVSEAAVSHALHELNSDLHENGVDWSAEGTIGGGTFDVEATQLNSGTWLLTAEAGHGKGKRKLEVVVARSGTPLSIPGMAAIVNKGPLGTLGNITIDGRDWDYDGANVVGPGVYGIMGGSSIGQGGSSAIGGNGFAPQPAAGPAISDPFHDWSSDEFDNDGDGEADQAGEGFPSGPDQAVSLPNGALKSIAQANGAYFSSSGQFSSYLSSNGGNVPSGKIIFLDFDLWQPADFGSTLNEDPSIIVMHNATGDAEMKNLHGQFKGLLLVDQVQHVNAGTLILGMIYSWAQSGNTYGNGNADVKFSSEVLANLPSSSDSTYFAVVSWRESVQVAGAGKTVTPSPLSNEGSNH